MTEEKRKSAPTISVSFPHDKKDECMRNLKEIVASLKGVPGTMVSSQSELIRRMLLGAQTFEEDGKVYIKFPVVDNSFNVVSGD